MGTHWRGCVGQVSRGAGWAGKRRGGNVASLSPSRVQVNCLRLALARQPGWCWSCAALPLRLPFLRKEGQVEQPCPQGAAKRSLRQAAGTASGLPGGSGAVWRHGVAGGVHNTHPQLLVRGLAAGGWPGGEQSGTLNQAQPKGARPGRGHLWRRTVLGCHGRGAARKAHRSAACPADPVRGASGLCCR